MEMEILSLRYQDSSGLFITYYYFIWQAEFDQYWIKEEVTLLDGETLPRLRSLGYPRKDITQKMCLDALDAMIEDLLEEQR